MIWVNGINVVNQAPDSLQTVRAFDQRGVQGGGGRVHERHGPARGPGAALRAHARAGGHRRLLSARVRAVRRVGWCAPPAEARTDLGIMTELGKRLDPADRPCRTAETCLRAALKSSHLETTLEELRRKGFVRSKRPRIAFAGLVFAHADGKYRFPGRLHDEAPPPAGYPLRLLTPGAPDRDSLPDPAGGPDGPASGVGGARHARRCRAWTSHGRWPSFRRWAGWRCRLS